jgi:alkylated DNA repair dioxygenase AlkB
MQACLAQFEGYVAAGHSLVQDGSSWVVIVRRYHPSDQTSFDELWKLRPDDPPYGTIMGRRVPFPRRTRAFGSDYAFSGQTADASPIEALPALARSYRTKTSIIKLHKLNGVLLNWYDASEGDYIGPHADDEGQLIRGEPILSITWTSPATHFRRFRLLPKKKEDVSLTLDLYDGDLVVMGGRCQTTHKHEIMKSRKRQRDECVGRRINQTDRAFRTLSPS